MTLIVANLLLLEMVLAAVYFVNPFDVFSSLSYVSAFDELRLGSEFGWTSYDDRPRPGSPGYETTCAAVFGDSFTHADEVADEQAWPALASRLLACEVENYGTGGYGTDQAVLKAEC